MKLFKNILVIFLITTANSIYAQETKGKVFSHYRELGEYAFSNTNLNDVTTGYFFDYAFGLYDNLTILDLNPRTDSTNADKMLAVLKLVEDADINEKFKVDTMLFPFMYGFYAANGQNALTIPLVITDIDMSVLKKDKKQMITEWEREEPFPKFYSYDFYQTNVFNASLFCDTFVYNNIQVYWTDETFVSNTEREVEHVYITAHNQTIEIPKSQQVSISHLYDENRPLKHLKITVEFSDGTTKETYQNLWLQKNTNQEELPETKSGDTLNYEKMPTLYGDAFPFGSYSIINSLSWNVYYGCNDEENENKLDKPYIILTGWGPYVDKDNINRKQHFGTFIDEAYTKFNIEGLFDELISAGYDVIVAGFTPPNASVIGDANLLIRLIDTVNLIKNNNGSYEENIIHGLSSGALVSQLALLKMENEHLYNNGTHHQTKLYISHDGEHQGANIPLGIQGCVKYLHDYHNSLFKIYVLNFLNSSSKCNFKI